MFSVGRANGDLIHNREAALGLSPSCESSPPGIEKVEQKLARRLAEHEEIAADLKAAIAALKRQPDLLETLNLLRKVGI